MFSAQVKAVLRELANLLTERVDAEDGGPGSGNWGHKGRPGQVGGSGKGGGNQYRGGKSGVLYTSSKSDWLNGLSGEKQHKASKFMQSMEKLKRPGQSTEAFIMENGATDIGASAVKEYLDLKGEARGWNQYANRLMDEHLDDNDKKIVDALGQKYGLMHKGNAVLPNDADTSAWDVSDLRTWNDLRSKAMGGPTSGQEAPDDLLVAAGLKEAPKPKAPNSMTKNDGWMDGISTEEQQRLRNLLGTSATGSITVAEREAGDILNVSAGHQEMENFNQYLNEKAKLLGVDYSDILASGRLSGALRDDQTKAVADALQTKLDEINLRDGTNLTLPEAMDKVEQEILSLNDSYLARTYLRLKSNALGTTPIRSYHTDVDIETLNRWKATVEKNVTGMRGPVDARKLFTSKTHEERVQSIERAKNVEEVGKALMETGLMPKDATINLQGVDAGLARNAALSYNKVAEKFPFMAGEWKVLQEKTLSDRTCARAYIFSDRREIELNLRYYRDSDRLKRTYEGCVKSGFHPAGTDYTSVVTHEIGHTLDGYLTNKGVAGSKLELTKGRDVKKGVTFAGILKKRVCKELKVKTTDTKTIKSMLSEYGAYKNDDQEWFAEAFAEAMHSPNPRPMAATMMKHLTQILKEEGLING